MKKNYFPWVGPASSRRFLGYSAPPSWAASSWSGKPCALQSSSSLCCASEKKKKKKKKAVKQSTLYWIFKQIVNKIKQNYWKVTDKSMKYRPSRSWLVDSMRFCSWSAIRPASTSLRPPPSPPPYRRHPQRCYSPPSRRRLPSFPQHSRFAWRTPT